MENQKLKKEFGQLVKQRRTKLNITQLQLADRANISCTYLREIERGIHTPTWINWLKICTELEIDPENFLNMINSQQHS